MNPIQPKSNHTLYKIPYDCLAQILYSFLDRTPTNFQNMILVSKQMFEILNSTTFRGQCSTLIAKNSGDDALLFSRRFFNIRSLDVSQSHSITLVGTNSIKYLSLKNINFSGCLDLRSEYLEPLQQIPLQSLNLSGCRMITHKGLVHLPTTLEDLNLSRCILINDKGLLSLSAMNLKILNISWCDITNKGLEYLPTTLQHLNIRGCNQITDLGLQYLIPMHLKVLYLNGYDRIKVGTRDAGLECLKQMPLQILDLSHSIITDAGLTHLTLTIQNLDLSWCTHITNEGIKTISQMPLEILSIRGCPLISDESLECLQQKLLRILNLYGCSQITDEGIRFLNKMPLVVLDISHCSITDVGLSQLPLSIDSLNLTWCSQITDVGLQYLQQMPLKCLVLSHCTRLSGSHSEWANSLTQTSLSLTFFQEPNLENYTKVRHQKRKREE